MTHKFKTGDLVRILTAHLSDVLIQELGGGRLAIYTGKIIAVNGDRMLVLLQDTHGSGALRRVLSDFVADNSIHCSTAERHLLHALNLETKHNSRLEVGIASNVV